MLTIRRGEGGKRHVRQFSLPGETDRHTWLPPRLSEISYFVSRLLWAINSLLPSRSAGSRITQEAIFRGR